MDEVAWRDGCNAKRQCGLKVFGVMSDNVTRLGCNRHLQHHGVLWVGQLVPPKEVNDLLSGNGSHEPNEVFTLGHGYLIKLRSRAVNHIFILFEERQRDGRGELFGRQGRYNRE